MIISHKYKFIFIKTQKTASTSIEVFLSDHCGEQDILTPVFTHVDTHKPRNRSSFNYTFMAPHLSAKKIKQLVPKNIWESYFKFCVERNPWDRMISCYYYTQYRVGHPISLEEYFNMNRFCKNAHLYLDDEDKILVDKFIYYENLNEGLQEVLDYLGIPFSGSLDIRAKGEFRTDRRHYKEVLTQRQADIITEQCKKEIELHGYTY